RHPARTSAQAPLPRCGPQQRLAQAPHRRAQPAQPGQPGPGPPRRRLGPGPLTRPARPAITPGRAHQPPAGTRQAEPTADQGPPDRQAGPEPAMPVAHDSHDSQRNGPIQQAPRPTVIFTRSGPSAQTVTPGVPDTPARPAKPTRAVPDSREAVRPCWLELTRIPCTVTSRRLTSTGPSFLPTPLITTFFMRLAAS